MKIPLKPRAPLPPPPPPPPGVTVTRFEPPPPPMAASGAFLADAPGQVPLPPPPPQMLAPVGPPPEAVIPVDYDGYITLARSSPNRMSSDSKMFWAMMAQAAAQKEIAERLGELLEFLGAYDGDETGEPRLSDIIATIGAKKGRK